MNKPELSVIVPVYNTLPYLEPCLSSLSRQTLSDMEVILVNDGSTDGSDKLLKKQSMTDSRFHYIEQANAGLSVARNTGITMAQGTYLAFLDSDDWLLTDNCMKQLCRMADRTEADMIAGNTWSVYPDGNRMLWGKNGKDVFTPNETMDGGEYFTRMLQQGCYVPMVYHYLYRNRFLVEHKFRFEPGLIHEDELWTPQALTSACRVTYTDISHYCYRQREGSIMTATAIERRIVSLQTIIDKLLEYASGYTNEVTDALIVKESIRVNILRLFRIACCLQQEKMDMTLYDKAREMLAVCETLEHWPQVRKRYSDYIFQFIRQQFNELQNQDISFY